MMEAAYTIWLRSMKRFVRSKSRVIGSLGMPFFFLVTLGVGFGSAFGGMKGGYIGFVAPGLVAMSILTAAMFSGIQIIWDKQFGFLKETLVAPVSRTEIMVGQTLGGATTAVLQGLMLFLVSFLMGVRVTGAPGFIIVLVFMALIGISFTALGIAFASRMADMHGFQLIMNFVVMPTFFLSGAIFPLSSAPSWLRVISYLDPLTYGVEGMRYGVLGTSQIPVGICFTVLAAFSLAMLLLGGYLFRKIKL